MPDSPNPVCGWSLREENGPVVPCLKRAVVAYEVWAAPIEGFTTGAEPVPMVLLLCAEHEPCGGPHAA